MNLIITDSRKILIHVLLVLLIIVNVKHRYSKRYTSIIVKYNYSNSVQTFYSDILVNNCKKSDHSKGGDRPLRIDTNSYLKNKYQSLGNLATFL